MSTIQITFLIFFFLLTPHLLAAPRTIVDHSGHKLIFPKPPSRIISTAPSHTEVLFALGLEKNIVGVTTQCDFPGEAKSIEKIGDIHLNIEKIIRLKPDLIVSHGGIQAGGIQKLQALGLPVVALHPTSIGKLLECFHLLGKITGKNSEAEQLIKQFQVFLKKKYKRKSVPRVLVFYWREPLMVFGKETLVDDLLTKLGAINLGAQGQGPSPVLNMEWVVRENPDVLIFTHTALPKKADLKKDAKWRRVKAVQTGRVLILPSPLLSREGPRSLDAMKAIYHFLKSPPPSSQSPLRQQPSAHQNFHPIHLAEEARLGNVREPQRGSLTLSPPRSSRTILHDREDLFAGHRARSSSKGSFVSPPLPGNTSPSSYET